MAYKLSYRPLRTTLSLSRLVVSIIVFMTIWAMLHLHSDMMSTEDYVESCKAILEYDLLRTSRLPKLRHPRLGRDTVIPTILQVVQNRSSAPPEKEGLVEVETINLDGIVPGITSNVSRSATREHASVTACYGGLLEISPKIGGGFAGVSVARCWGSALHTLGRRYLLWHVPTRQRAVLEQPACQWRCRRAGEAFWASSCRRLRVYSVSKPLLHQLME
ncbi:hypothetical protein HAX54_027209 [Datura stramonium]|uniref:Uncharacterized protein n=1 Tax=Datura stramonium TaxID=4076 RepID=A0ABS8RL47_DATST|nr:hypothetical protein [Datura stramonium]